MMNAPIPGICRFCKCSGDMCTLPDGDNCAWLGPSRTCCTNPACIRARYAEQDRVKLARAKANRKRTPAEIHELIRNRGRKQKSITHKKGCVA